MPNRWVFFRLVVPPAWTTAFSHSYGIPKWTMLSNQNFVAKLYFCMRKLRVFHGQNSYSLYVCICKPRFSWSKLLLCNGKLSLHAQTCFHAPKLHLSLTVLWPFPLPKILLACYMYMAESSHLQNACCSDRNELNSISLPLVSCLLYLVCPLLS